MKPLPISNWLEGISVRWVTWWRNLPVMRLLGAIETAFGIAILVRPYAGPVGAGAGLIGLSPYWFAGALLICGLPMLALRLHMDWFMVLIWPMVAYAIFAINWAWSDPRQPLTAIVANVSILALLLKLASCVAIGNHDHG